MNSGTAPTMVRELTANGFIGVEPVDAPTNDLVAPDREVVASEHPEIDDDSLLFNYRVREKLRPVEKICRVARTVGFVLVGVLLLGMIIGGPGSFYGGTTAGDNSLLKLIASVLTLSPAFSVWALYKIRKQVNSLYTMTYVSIGIHFVALAAIGLVTYGVGFPAIPLVIGFLALRSRKPLIWSDGEEYQPGITHQELIVASELAMANHTDAKAQRAHLVENRFLAEWNGYQQRLAEHAALMQRFSPFVGVPVVRGRDFLLVGGSAPERAEVTDRVAQAWGRSGPVWIVDLGGEQVGSKALESAVMAGLVVGRVDAGTDDGIVRLLDGLSSFPGRRSKLVEVLSSAFSEEAGVDRSRAQRGDIEDALRRIGKVLVAQTGSVSVRSFHDALEIVLSTNRSASAVRVRQVDDFGLSTAPTSDNVVVSDAVASALREVFTELEQREFFRELNTIRRQLASLLDELSTPHVDTDWRAGNAVNLTQIDHRRQPADRMVRSLLVLEHHVQVLKEESTPAPSAILILVSAELPPSVLEEFSLAAKARGVALSIIYQKLAPSFRELARSAGRAVGAMGGIGSEAAEELSQIFGKEWSKRVQSYQDGWSASDSRSRATSSGRNWSSSESVNRSVAVSRGSSSSYSSGPQGGSSTRGRNSGRTVTDGYSRSESMGGNDSTTDTDSTTQGRTGGTTIGLQYEEAARGADISHLPPFTMLLREQREIRFADIDPALVLPPQFLKQLTGDRAS